MTRSASTLLTMMIPLLAGASISRAEITCNTTYRFDPIGAAPTDTTFNAALAPTGKIYADNTGDSVGYAGELPANITLARGGSLLLDYSNDGAKDLVSIAWPEVESAGFPGEKFYDDGIALTQRDAAGNITVKSDPSGTRVQTYQQNRPLATTWTDGHHKPYQILREYDDHGRTSKIELLRNNVSIHTITPEYPVASDEISGMSTDGFTADVLRDPDSRLIIGFTRGGVEQHWDRGTAGRITGAHTGNTVTGAPTFNYTTFDPKGRRKSVQTNRGSWFYDYKGGNNGDGQLASASNGTLNAQFNYNFDGIGRRVDFVANANHPLNQFVSIEHPQTPRNLYITAHPEARLWVNGVEAQQFDGAWIHPLGHPGASGGWIPWTVTGVLEDAGEGAGDPPANPHANADAIAVQSGHTWFPPTLETLTYDADGNRESSALWHFGWDGRNRLVRARTKTWDTAPQGWDITFDYDAEGRRFKKQITRYESGERVEEKVVFFVWDGWNLLYERHQDFHGNLLFDRKYIWGPDIADGAAGGAGGLLLIRETRGQTTKDYYPIYDGSGHVTGLTDSTGNLVAEYWYGPFGELIESKGELAEINPIRYATKYYDAETGLYYFGFRYYDPVTGQWMNREPLGEDESLNLYAYCHNDPVNRVDVLGLSEVGIDWKGATDGYGLVYYHLIREPDGGARGGFFNRAWTWLWNDGNIVRPNPRAFFEKIELGRISINDIGRDPSEIMVELGGSGGPSVAYSDLIQLGNRDSSTAKLNTPEERRLAVMCLLSRYLAKDNGDVGDHLAGVADKIVSAPFQGIANILGIETSTILEASHQKGHVTYFNVDSKSFTRGGWEGENILKQAELASYFIVAGQVYKMTQAGRLVLIAPNSGGVYSTIGGKGMDPVLFNRIQTAFERKPDRVMASNRASELHLGPNRLIEGETLSQNVIALRINPSTSSVYEELIHTAQLRRGMTNVVQMEIEAAQKLIRFADKYKIPASETAATIKRLRILQGGTR